VGRNERVTLVGEIAVGSAADETSVAGRVEPADSLRVRHDRCRRKTLLRPAAPSPIATMSTTVAGIEIVVATLLMTALESISLRRLGGWQRGGAAFASGRPFVVAAGSIVRASILAIAGLVAGHLAYLGAGRRVFGRRSDVGAAVSASSIFGRGIAIRIWFTGGVRLLISAVRTTATTARASAFVHAATCRV
jgi:hypothetical protein